MVDEARALTEALNGRWQGDYGMARCPAHEDRNPSLRIKLGDNGRPLLRCFTGCSQEAVLDALKARGLWEGRAGNWEPTEAELAEIRRRREAEEARQREKTAKARNWWQEAKPIDGTPAETYLRGRGITTALPPTLRYHHSLKHGPTGLFLPALVAAVCAWPSREPSAVHRVFIKMTGGAAPVSESKLTYGPPGRGAVRLARAGETLALTEGIETGLSVQQVTGIPTWACLSTSGLINVTLPDNTKTVVIYADHDKSKRADGTTFNPGREAAEKAKARFVDEGREAQIKMPKETGKDFNDLLRGVA